MARKRGGTGSAMSACYGVGLIGRFSMARIFVGSSTAICGGRSPSRSIDRDKMSHRRLWLCHCSADGSMEVTMRTECRRCGSPHYPLTPVGYCYLCLSQFGSATQVAMLLMAYNPSLSVEDLRQCLRLDDRATAEYIWQNVRLRLDEEARNK